jgi:hypothetical protein
MHFISFSIQSRSLGKIIEHKNRSIRVKVSSNDHKYDIFGKFVSLKGSRIFINEDIIPEDQDELRKFKR